MHDLVSKKTVNSEKTTNRYFLKYLYINIYRNGINMKNSAITIIIILILVKLCLICYAKNISKEKQNINKDKQNIKKRYSLLSHSFKSGSKELEEHMEKRKLLGIDTSCVNHIDKYGDSYTICYNTVNLDRYKPIVEPNGMPYGTTKYRVDLVKI